MNEHVVICVETEVMPSAPVPSTVVYCAVCRKPLWLSMATQADLKRLGVTASPMCQLDGAAYAHQFSEQEIIPPGPNTRQALEDFGP